MVVCAFAIGGCGIYVTSMQKNTRKNEEHWGNSGNSQGNLSLSKWQPLSVDRDPYILPTVHPLCKFTMGIYKDRIIFIFALAIYEEALITNFL